MKTINYKQINHYLIDNQIVSFENMKQIVVQSLIDVKNDREMCTTNVDAMKIAQNIDDFASHLQFDFFTRNYTNERHEYITTCIVDVDEHNVLFDYVIKNQQFSIVNNELQID
jgi:hypothetical protein